MEILPMPELVIHGFETSNNIKVRVALGYKKIPYTFKSIHPKEREEIIRISGQRLTPVMEHGSTVLFDSAAILRYLEANFRDRPALFGKYLAEQWAIEDLEFFARHTLAGPMMELVHHRVNGGVVDDAMRDGCNADFWSATTTLVNHLDGRQWLVGEAMSAADVTAAAVMYRVRQGNLFPSSPDSVQLQSWEDQVISFDEHRSEPGA
jgi:glutathione S-transferase